MSPPSALALSLRQLSLRRYTLSSNLDGASSIFLPTHLENTKKFYIKYNNKEIKKEIHKIQKYKKTVWFFISVLNTIIKI